MPDWLFYAIVTLWGIWTLNEARLSWWISKRVGHHRNTWGSVCIHLYWMFTVFLWFYILMGLSAISLISTLFS